MAPRASAFEEHCACSPVLACALNVASGRVGRGRADRAALYWLWWWWCVRGRARRALDPPNGPCAPAPRRVPGLRTFSQSAAELTADIKKQSSDLSGDVDKNLGAVRTQMAAVKTRLKDLLAKKIKELNDKRKASVAKMDTGIKSVQEVSGDCNYATHYKQGGKCVQLTDCNKGDEKFKYHGHGTNRQFPSYIWKKETKTTDRVCKYAAYRRFYSLSDHVYFHFVRWPAWQYPVYNEHALVAVCKQAGMK